MKIKDLNHAIDLTIERHQAVIDGWYVTFSDAKVGMKPRNWTYKCPLCEHEQPAKIFDCALCPWVTIQGEKCIDSQLNYNHSPQSIQRLKAWKRGEKFDPTKEETK